MQRQSDLSGKSRAGLISIPAHAIAKAQIEQEDRKQGQGQKGRQSSCRSCQVMRPRWTVFCPESGRLDSSCSPILLQAKRNGNCIHTQLLCRDLRRQLSRSLCAQLMLSRFPVNGRLICTSQRLSQAFTCRLSRRAQLEGLVCSMSASLTERVPTAKLSSGHTTPLLGLGTSGLSGAKATEATHEALNLGYKVRHSEAEPAVAT